MSENSSSNFGLEYEEIVEKDELLIAELISLAHFGCFSKQYPKWQWISFKACMKHDKVAALTHFLFIIYAVVIVISEGFTGFANFMLIFVLIFAIIAPCSIWSISPGYLVEKRRFLKKESQLTVERIKRYPEEIDEDDLEEIIGLK